MPTFPAVTSSTVSPAVASPRALANVQASAADRQVAVPWSLAAANNLPAAVVVAAMAGPVVVAQPPRTKQAPAKAISDLGGLCPACVPGFVMSRRIRLPLPP